MADLNQNIEMTKLKKSYKWCGKETCVCRKGVQPQSHSRKEWSGAWQGKCVWQIKMWLQKRFGLSPKEGKSGLGCSKKVGYRLSLTVDGSGVGHGKVDGCGRGQGRAEPHCTLVQQVYCWFYSQTGPFYLAFCLCTCESCGQGQAEQYCTLV
jgi:hypothetical protein